MPKLTRLHLTGIGHRDAKFDRLSLRFVDARNRPTHTLVWLPNGGGKSLMIAFKYAALRPHKRDFLGLKTGRGADLEDFVATGKLAVVLMEFDFSEVGGERLVVGYAALRKESSLERTYFSFRAHPALAWETLPVAGLGQEAPNLGKLLGHFRASAEKDKGRIAYFETISQSDWEVHLRDELKLDPEIFGHHLVMNSDEGGVTKLFAKKSVDEYMQLFLQLALEHESIYRITETGDRIDQVRVLVADYKRAHHENPRRDLIRNLCVELLPVLQRIQAAKLHQDEVKRQLGDAEASGARLLRSIALITQHLEGQIEKATAEIKTKEEEERKFKSERSQSDQWADGYGQLYCRLYFDEAEAAQSEAGSRQGQAAYKVRLYAAAAAAARRNNAENAHQVLVEEQRAKLQQLEPDLLALQQIGARLRWILQERALRLKEDEAVFISDFSDANSQRAKADQELKNLAEIQRQTEKKLTEVVRLQGDLQQKRKLLREKGWLNEGETAVSASNRWHAKVEELEEQEKADTESQAEARGLETSKLQRKNQTQNRLNQLTTEQETLEGKLEGFRSELSMLRAMSGMVSVATGKEISPWNESLGAALENRRTEARKEALRFRLEGQEDERTIAHYQPPTEPLFPPPRDLETVRAILKQNGIHAVSSAYSQLNVAHAHTNDAEEKLRAAPSEWSGLFLANPKEFERAQELVKTAPIARPVILVNGSLPVSSPGKITSPHSHVVLPVDRGLWNRSQAKAEIHLIQERQQRIQEALNSVDKEEAEAAAAYTALGSFVSRYPKITVDTWQQDFDRLGGDITGANAAHENARLEHVEAVEKHGMITTRLMAGRAELSQARPIAQKLRDHVKEFESRSEEWNSEESRLRGLIEAQTNQAPALKQALEQASALLEAFPTRQATLIDRRTEQQKDEQRLIERYVGPVAPPSKDETAALLWEKFESGVRQYEKASDDKVLKLKLEQAAKEQKAARDVFTDATRGFQGSPWTDWQNRDDLPIIAEKARQEESKAAIDLTRAKQTYEIAAANWPVSKRMSRGGEQIDPARPATNSIEAEQFKEACLTAAKSAERLREEIATSLIHMREARSALKELLPKYAGLESKAPQGLGETEISHADFTENFSDNSALADRVFAAVRSQREILRSAESAIKTLFEKDWTGVLSREAYTRNSLELRTRLVDLGRSEIEHDPEKHVRSLTSIKDACDDQITHLAVQRASLVQHLSARADLAAKRLKSLQTESYLPKDLDSWGGHPFLKVELSLRNDETERARYLGELVEKWAKESDESDLPAGHVLAFLCLKAVLTTNGATLKILKPTQRLELYYHDITELSGFSEGQRVTAAILIYSILVRLRQKQAGSLDGMPLDAGYLLLDNPLGKANASALVDLQLRVAKAMGLQLIYASGINDPGTLHNFGHILRLKNTALDPRSGDKLVQEDKRGSKLSAVELGVYPKAVVPPVPPKPTQPTSSL